MVFSHEFYDQNKSYVLADVHLLVPTVHFSIQFNGVKHQQPGPFFKPLCQTMHLGGPPPHHYRPSVVNRTVNTAEHLCKLD